MDETRTDQPADRLSLIGEKLSVRRGERMIVCDVSFRLNAGDALVITGENGSGKSTLLRAVAGLLPLAAGRVIVAGPGAEDCEVRELIHYLGHQNGMKGALTVRENLDFWQAFCGNPWMDVEDALEQVNLLHAIDLPFSYLSAGMKRRASIAKLLVSEKPVWVVDEPTAALDAASSDMFRGICQEFCSMGGILIAATHLPLGIDGAQSLRLETLSGGYDDDLAEAAAEGELLTPEADA